MVNAGHYPPLGLEMLFLLQLDHLALGDLLECECAARNSTVPAYFHSSKGSSTDCVRDLEILER